MQLFEKQIHSLNFSFLHGSEDNGVLLTNDYENINSNIASPDILFALETAKMKFNADAVYFRHFSDGRGNIPQLYLFDFTHKSITTEEKNRIHIQMWNGYQVPAYIIIEKSSVSIFDSRKRPNEDNDGYAKELLTLTGQALSDFRAKDFDNGLFWDEQDEKKDFRFEESATRDLIRGLKEVYLDFQKESGLDRHVALKLLVQSLLIKYLEERDEKSASGYFAVAYFKKHFQCSNFCDTIRDGKLLDLLDQLAKDFNGKIFEWDKEAEIEQRNAIQHTEVRKLADYLDGKIQNNQYVLWRLYSFTHLPVEVISSVYEELLTDSKDIVYTPEMIVSTLVDECMPLKQPKENFKIIDVSCGSGIFLVKTYKRIVQWWRYNEWKKTGKLVKPSLSVLKELLLKSIHGIDIEQDAIRLSIFSLALAILDEVDLDPPTWGKLKFPDLSNNIITKDFFNFITAKPKADFDLVIGNPPFNLPPVNGKEPNRTKYFEELKQSIGYKSELNIPDENPALHFLVQSLQLLNEDAVLCLIQPSVPLLYKKNTEFRNELFERYNLLQVIDLTNLSNKLWGSKTIATAAVFLQNTLPDSEAVLHLVANKTFSNQNRLFLEFDYYDFHFVTKEDVLTNPYVWKANLLGGGRINSLLKRLSKLETIEQYIKSKKTLGWEKGEGFIDNPITGKSCNYITGKKYLPTKAFSEAGINMAQIEICDIQKFHRPRNKSIYTPPHLLIRANIGKVGLIAHLSDEYLVFRNKIIGIHAPESQKAELKYLYDFLTKNGKLLRFYILATSSQIKVNRHTVPMTEDFMDLPFSLNQHDVNISTAEDILINDVLDIQISNTNITKSCSDIEVIEYSKIFCKTLNSIYKKEKSFQLFKVIDAGKYYALHFEYTSETLTPKQEKITDLEQYIEEAIPTRNDNPQKTHIQRIIKAYGQDSIILAKPKQLRYWLPSIALRDADETFADYIKSRY
ncbi:MAG: SAM-dependent methyltransferase [Bacteroidetes bacterium]|nr:SAM-dependent methyltransferase [Bacteroidota bacterium]